jgi:hypothetical protein
VSDRVKVSLIKASGFVDSLAFLFVKDLVSVLDLVSKIIRRR